MWGAATCLQRDGREQVPRGGGRADRNSSAEGRGEGRGTAARGEAPGARLAPAPGRWAGPAPGPAVAPLQGQEEAEGEGQEAVGPESGRGAAQGRIPTGGASRARGIRVGAEGTVGEGLSSGG